MAMRNFWLMARHEYRKMARTRSFWLSTLSLPFIFVAIMVVGVLAAMSGQSRLPVGYVDLAGLIQPGAYTPAPGEVELRLFAHEGQAEAALLRGEIQAYYLIPENYWQAATINLVYGDELPPLRVRRTVNNLMRASLVANLPPEIQERILTEPTMVNRTIDGRREMPGEDFVTLIVSFAAGPLFMIAIVSSAGYLLQVVTDEKENRTMEILITSLSPGQLITGKAVGLMGVALTQMGIWVAAGIFSLAVASRFYDIMDSFAPPWELLTLILLFFIPTYALVAGIMTAVGGAVNEVKQGQQIAGIINLLFIFPFFVIALIMSSPNSPLAVAMSLFPTTAFVTIALRWGMTIVPWEQVIMAWLIVTATAVLSLWASGRIFRAGMLHYGQGLNLRAALRSLRS
jgi:ABC-2 type transport system permease protein